MKISSTIVSVLDCLCYMIVFIELSPWANPRCLLCNMKLLLKLIRASIMNFICIFLFHMWFIIFIFLSQGNISWIKAKSKSFFIHFSFHWILSICDTEWGIISDWVCFTFYFIYIFLQMLQFLKDKILKILIFDTYLMTSCVIMTASSRKIFLLWLIISMNWCLMTCWVSSED